MNLINVLWIFILLASLAPMVKQRVLDSERFRLMRKVEEKRGSRVIALGGDTTDGAAGVPALLAGVLGIKAGSLARGR